MDGSEESLEGGKNGENFDGGGGLTELSMMASVPPGRRRRKASLTMAAVARAGHSWN